MEAMTTENAVQHTPGPWHTGHDDRWPLIFGPEGTRRSGGDLLPIARVNGEQPEDHANAALIAAAPEMLAALKSAGVRVAGLLDDDDAEISSECGEAMMDLLDNIQAAIAKAEGR